MPVGTDGPALSNGALSSVGREAPGNGGGPAPIEPGGAHMTLYEHLAELRRRLFVCVGVILCTSVAGWFLYTPVLAFMAHAYTAFCHQHPGRLLSCQLLVREPAEGFLTRLKLAAYVGAGLAAPVWLWELWRFVTPGLKKNEKRYAVPFLLSALTLFAIGVTIAVVVWPKALDWLVDVGGSGVTVAYSLGSYVNLYVLVCLVFGVVFLYPVLVMFLIISGVVPTAQWRRWRRPAIVVLFAVAAIVTPSNDPFTFLGMAVPMIVFYEMCILVGRLMRK